MCVIVFHSKELFDDMIYGPFPDSQAAMKWASDKWGIGGTWYWLPLTKPD